MGKTNILLLVFVIGSIALGIFFNYQESAAIKKCASLTLGKVIRKYKILKKGEFIECNYVVKGENFSANFGVSGTFSLYSNYAIGDTISIEYACEDPQLSRLTPPPNE